MCTELFEGVKEILPVTRFDIDNETYCDVSIVQYWNIPYEYDCSCGVEKTRKWRKKVGWSKEYSLAIEGELGFSLTLGLASISPKITAKINKSLNIYEEDEQEEITKFTAPKCGMHKITVYQLISEWHIKRFKNKKRLFRRSEILEYTPPPCIIRENIWTERNNVYKPLPNCNCEDDDKYDGNVTLRINNGIINLPCKRFDDKIEIYGMTNKLFSKNEILKFDELPIFLSKSLHSSFKAKILTFGEKLPILNVIELITKFEKLILEIKEIVLKYFPNEIHTIKKIFEFFVTILYSILSSIPLQILKDSLTDDEEKLKKMKQYLSKIRNGDISELSNKLNVFYKLYDEEKLLSNLDPWIKEDKEKVKAKMLDMFREIHAEVKEFYESSKEIIIDFLRKVADLILRLIDVNYIEGVILMIKEFISGSEDQIDEFHNKANRLLNLILGKQTII